MQVISRVSTSTSEEGAPSRKPRNYGNPQLFSDPSMSPSSPTLTVMKTNGHNNSMLDEFSQYVESAFGACEGNEGQDLHHDHEEDSTSTTFWELLITMYLPLSALWLRQSVFGITVLVRTVLLGHLLRLVFGNLADWINEKSPWLHALLQPMGPHSKPDPKAWPPPALSALALFTVVTFVVHPDGFTWVMLGKVKKSLLSMLQALAECWQLLITDYGVMPSIFASITIAALIFLMFLMLRSVSPKRARQTSPPPDKRKKKRKGHTRRGNNNGKIKAHPSTPSRQLETPTSTTLSIDPPSPVTSTCSLPSSPPENLPLIPHLPMENSTPNRQLDSPKIHHTLDETPEESPAPAPAPPITTPPMLPPVPINSSKMMFEKDVRGRARVPSVSTIDTSTMSDDMSCESNSIRSELSVHVPYTPSNHAMPVQQESLQPVASTDASADHHLKRGARTQPRRNNRTMGTGNAKSKLNHSPKSTGNDGTSRWDALRPVSNSKQTHIHAQAQAHAHAPERHNLATTGRNPENTRPNHLHPGPRQTIRRNGRGGGGNPKRVGRTVATNVNHNPQTAGLPQTPSSPPRPKQFFSPTPISPPTLDRCPRGNTVMPPANVPTLPPPGLGAISSSTRNNVVAEGTQFFSVQPPSADVPILFPSLPPEQSRPLYCPTPLSHGQAHISPSFLTSATDSYDKWNIPTASSVFSTSRLDNESSLPTRSRPCPGEVYYYSPNVVVVKENPFAPEDSEAQIEAHLQALGGQMAGSILDF